jgi:hypothetical protein
MGVDDGNLRPFSDEMIVSKHMYCEPNTMLCGSYTDRDLDFTRSILSHNFRACTISSGSMENYEIRAIRDRLSYCISCLP